MKAQATRGTNDPRLQFFGGPHRLPQRLRIELLRIGRWPVDLRGRHACSPQRRRSARAGRHETQPGYFSPYESPYEAYMNFMNSWHDLKYRLAEKGIEV